MSMIIEEDNKILRFDVPNSEASINAQHFGIADRTVGSYYMSENYELCKSFLDDFEGEYYIDISLTIRNIKKILAILKDRDYSNAFKSLLVPQFKNLEALEWLLQTGDYYYQMKSPTVNDNQKYLKLDNEDDVVNSFRSLILGDLCSLYIKKIGSNGYMFYVDKNPSFDEIIKGNKVLKWMK